MNQKIEKINSEIKQVLNALKVAESPFKAKIKDLETDRNIEYFKIFEKSKMLKQAIDAVESSTQYGIDESGMLYAFKHLDLAGLFGKDESTEEALDALSTWLEDSGIYLDREHSALQLFQGDYIGINEDGDVYHDDCGKVHWIVQSGYYDSVEERDELIEKYMQKSGVFPTVVKVDRYGNVTGPVNTQKSKVTA